jgi:hypothetical protein
VEEVGEDVCVLGEFVDVGYWMSYKTNKYQYRFKTRRAIGFVLIFHYCGGVESSDGKVGVAWLLWWLPSVKLTCHGLVSHLQNGDDILFIGETCVKNLWG